MNVVPGSASCGRDGFVEGREVACFPARRSAARKNGTSLARREMKRMTPWSEPVWAGLLLGANREEIRPDREIVFVVLGILALPLPLPLLLPLLRQPPPASPRGRIHPTPNSIRSSCASAPASSSCVAASATSVPTPANETEQHTGGQSDSSSPGACPSSPLHGQVPAGQERAVLLPR